MNVELDEDTQRLVEEEIKTGRSRNPGDFIGRAVKHFVIARELGEEFTPEEVEAKIARGLEQVERNEVIEGEEAFRRLREHSYSRRRQGV